MPDSDAESKEGDAPSAERVARRAAAGALAAELGHDLQGALNLFRLVTERLERGQALDQEDASLLREELDRMSRLSARLRDLATTPLSRAPHTPRQLLAHALGLAPELSDRGLQLDVRDSDGQTVLCDAPLVARAVRELLDNALEARREGAGVRWEPGEPSCLCVWDDGEGFTAPPGQAGRFGFTTRVGAAGLGLALALRAARAHGFRLETSRKGELTEVRLWFVATRGGGRSTTGAG